MHAQKQEREEIAQARANGRNHQGKMPAVKWVFIDETGTTIPMSRRDG